eukprot:3535587-Rhodomonas_salina.1
MSVTEPNPPQNLQNHFLSKKIRHKKFPQQQLDPVTRTAQSYSTQYPRAIATTTDTSFPNQKDGRKNLNKSSPALSFPPLPSSHLLVELGSHGAIKDQRGLVRNHFAERGGAGSFFGGCHGSRIGEGVYRSQWGFVYTQCKVAL